MEDEKKGASAERQAPFFCLEREEFFDLRS
jgi:hypothetical protein